MVLIKEKIVSEVLKSRKGITYVISNEDMDHVIQIIKSLENIGELLDGVIEAKKHEEI